ncbi:hypothetical protein P3T76_011219 [Phytophthora citrophthora]|uniref:Uncharacterized protein n=1 Tax=Phytophthora citrophthora TaxID=4793 RepID=A0AAD9LFF5_9STRA|nr:hypothetical protein P3T76_011219 [Phytophthora citrophthora]
MDDAAQIEHEDALEQDAFEREQVGTRVILRRPQTACQGHHADLFIRYVLYLVRLAPLTEEVEGGQPGEVDLTREQTSA